MDAIGGLVLSTGSVIPGTNTFTLDDQVGADTTLERFIKLDDPKHSVLDTYYTVTVTELEFYYLDTANNNT